ncbi:MAG: Gldg family protein, partial [Thermoguttaceae bacterium]|nr:Gldg family protein [Thermoguttaceae bacterium]
DQEEIFMGVVFRCGMEKVTLPFVARGIPAEYELVRSLMTVTSQKRKVLGVLETDAGLFQTVDPTRGTLTGDAAIITELKKSYDVRKIDPANPITESMDALLAVQPSTLSPEAWVHFMDYVKTGNSVIIFEDPFPVFAPSIPGTSATKNAPTNPMFGMMMPPQPLPKANDRELWDLLGVNFARDRIVFQNYNPEVRYRQFPKEFVWIDTALRYENHSVLNQDDIAVSGLQKTLFPHPGYIASLAKSGLTFTPLIRTGVETGCVPYSELLKTNEFGEKRLQPNPRRTLTNESYVLAAKIEGTVTLPAPTKPAPSAVDPSVANAGVTPHDESAEHAGSTDTTRAAMDVIQSGTSTGTAGEPGPQGVQGVAGTPAQTTDAVSSGTIEAKINVLLIADLDCTTNQFFMIREQGTNDDYGIQFDFDNVTMTLNLIDQAMGEERFCEIRSRRRAHRTLSKIDALTKDAETSATKEIEALREEFSKTSTSIQAEANKKLSELQAKLQKQYEKDGQLSETQMVAVVQELAKIKERQARQNEQKIQELTREMEDNIKEIDTRLVRQEQKIQDRYKLWSILLPPIPPLLVSLIVLGVRHSREKEGASRKRVRHAA